MPDEPMLRTCPQCSTPSGSEQKYCPSCGFPIGTLGVSREDPFVGRSLPGGYHIVDLISVGGMGRVYRAEQSVLGRTVAVKIVHPHLLSDDNAALRFLTEARAASQLNHPNSISIFDFGRTEQGQPYLVMEFLRGRDLARIVAEEGLLDFSRIVNVLCQVLSALSEAHELGIIHRDLKPENVILEPLRRGGDLVKVLDFGLAKLRTDPRAPRNVTSPGIVCGTPDYMAPEQGRGDQIDGRSDLYAVGVMLYQLLTGRLPYDADSATQIVLMHLTAPIPDPRQTAPQRNIPDSLAEVTMRAMQKEVRRRYQDALEFSDALRLALDAALSQPPSRSSGFSQGSNRPQTTVTCTGCGLSVPAGRFCLECGARLPTPSLAPIRANRVELPLILLARDEDTRWCRELLSQPRRDPGRPRGARVVGELGVGKTRFLTELLGEASGQGLVVVQTGPDPYGAEVPFHALRRALELLLDTNLEELLENSASEGPVALGLAEILRRPPAASVEQGDPRARRLSRVEALTWAVSEALQRSGAETVLLAIDDLHRVDHGSQESFRDFLESELEPDCLLLGAHVPAFDPGWGGRHPVRVLHGIPRLIGERLLRTTHAEAPSELLEASEFLPLLLEQLLRYSQEGGSDPTPRVADLIMQRLDVLPPTARRIIQAVAVLGDGAELKSILQLLGHLDDASSSLELLEQRGMLTRLGLGFAIAHPLIRDLVLAAIPAAARRELHARALGLADPVEIPLEARAQLAFFAEDAFQALLLLEQVAESADARQDNNLEILALRRGLDLARQEISRGQLEDPMRAVLIFSRKLGAALTRSGNLTDAEGVLREALDYATPSSGEYARLLAGLAHVAHHRGRHEEALTHLDRAILAAEKVHQPELVQLFHGTRTAWATQSSAK